MVLCAARRKHRKIALRKSFARSLIDAVEGIYEAIAKGIGINVKRRVDEMRYIGPIGLGHVAKLDCRPKAIGLFATPQITNLRRSKLAVAAFEMELAFKSIKRDLPHHRIQHVFDLGGQHGAALG